MAGLVAGWPALAQSPAPRPPAVTDIGALEAEAAARRAAQQARAEELAAIEARLRTSTEAKAKLDAEVAEIARDRTRLNTALIAATRNAQGLEARIAGLEERLAGLEAGEQAVRRSLGSRRHLIADVLAALQRMGRRPPPAVLVRPEDMLEAVRASMLLGAVVPELRIEVETLAADLREMLRLRERIAIERTALGKEFEQLAAERQRLAALVEARSAREAETRAESLVRAEELAALGRDADGLRQLVDQLALQATRAQRLAEETRRQLEAQTRETRDRMAALAFRDPARLAPRAPFEDLRGRLLWPAAGTPLRRFGAPDGAGGQARGLSLTTRPQAIVSAPADGWVMFAGPFRTFGQLLILNPGGDYYVLLAGMESLDVVPQQFVLAGEPLGRMGSRQDLVNVTLGDGAGAPVLYVEFRKDGQSIDSTPWWAETTGQSAQPQAGGVPGRIGG